MTIEQRIRVVMVLAAVFYFAIIGAGLGGFDPVLWGVAILLFVLWHVLIHHARTHQGTAWPVVLVVHGVIAAICLWLGHALGNLTGFAPNPAIAFSLALAATGLARMVNVSREEAAEIQRLLDESADLTAAESPGASRRDAPAVCDSDGSGSTQIQAALDEISRLPAAGSEPEVLKPLVERLARSGPLAEVLQQLERTDSRHLPFVQAHAALALTPEAARDTQGSDALHQAFERTLATDRPQVITQAAQAARHLVGQMPDVAGALPAPEALRHYVARFENRDSDAADALEALRAQLAQARNG